MHRAALTVKNDLVQNVNCAKGKKPCIMRISTRESIFFFSQLAVEKYSIFTLTQVLSQIEYINN